MDVHHVPYVPYVPLKKDAQEMMSNIGESVLAQAKQRLFDCLGYGGCGGGAVERSAREWRVTSNSLWQSSSRSSVRGLGIEYE